MKTNRVSSRYEDLISLKQSRKTFRLSAVRHSILRRILLSCVFSWQNPWPQKQNNITSFSTGSPRFCFVTSNPEVRSGSKTGFRGSETLPLNGKTTLLPLLPVLRGKVFATTTKSLFPKPVKVWGWVALKGYEPCRMFPTFWPSKPQMTLGMMEHIYGSFSQGQFERKD